MKVGINKLDGVIGDMELVKKQTVSYETMSAISSVPRLSSFTVLSSSSE